MILRTTREAARPPGPGAAAADRRRPGQVRAGGAGDRWLCAIRALAFLRLVLPILIGYGWLRSTAWLRSPASQAAAMGAACRAWGARLRRGATALGGLAIKVCQLVALRSDWLPAELTGELLQLVDRVPGAPYPAVKRALEADLGAPVDRLFRFIDAQPVAAASLGQVHRAMTWEGDLVAVKVLRPSMERLWEADLAAVRLLAGCFQWLWGRGHRYDPRTLADELRPLIKGELDLRLEAERLQQFAALLEPIPDVRIPRHCPAWTGRSVLVMEFIEGVRLHDRQGLMEAGLEPRDIARRLLDLYLLQALRFGCVHGDPHPGNFLVQGDGTLCLLDFGLVLTLSPAERRSIIRLGRAVMSRDPDLAVEALTHLGIASPQLSRWELRDRVTALLDRLDEIAADGPDLERMAGAVQQWLRETPLQLSARPMLLLRAVALLTGLINTLDPAFPWREALAQAVFPGLAGEGGGPEGDWASRIRRWIGPEAAGAAQVVAEEVYLAGLALLRLPGRLDRALRQAGSGALRVDLSALDARLRRQERLLRATALAVVAAGAAVAGAILHVGGSQTEGAAALGISALLLLYALRRMR